MESSLALIAVVLGVAAISQRITGKALILGVVLAPTDAALGQSGRHASARAAENPPGAQRGKRAQHGICVPLLLAAVAAADVESEISHGRSAGRLPLEEIGVGGLVGGLLTAALVTGAGAAG